MDERVEPLLRVGKHPRMVTNRRQPGIPHTQRPVGRSIRIHDLAPTPDSAAPARLLGDGVHLGALAVHVVGRHARLPGPLVDELLAVAERALEEVEEGLAQLAVGVCAFEAVLPPGPRGERGDAGPDAALAGALAGLGSGVGEGVVRREGAGRRWVGGGCSDGELLDVV